MPIRNITDNQANVSFTLDQFKSLLHYTDKKGFATGVDKTNGTFKLDGKGKLTNVNRFRYAIKRQESNEVQSVQIRSALVDAFRKANATQEFLAQARSALGLDEDLNPDLNKRDGNALESHKPLQRRVVKELILRFNESQKVARKEQTNKSIETAGESFRENLKDGLYQVLDSDGNVKTFMQQNTVQSLKKLTDAQLKKCVNDFVAEGKNSGGVTLQGLKDLTKNINEYIFNSFTANQVLTDDGMKTWRSVVSNAVIELADRFECKDQLSEYLREELKWDFEVQDVRQDSVEEVQHGHAAKSLDKLPEKGKAFLKKFKEQINNLKDEQSNNLKGKEVLAADVGIVSSLLIYKIRQDIPGFVDKINAAQDKVVDELLALDGSLKSYVEDKFTSGKSEHYKIENADVFSAWKTMIGNAVLDFADELGCREELKESMNRQNDEL